MAKRANTGEWSIPQQQPALSFFEEDDHPTVLRRVGSYLLTAALVAVFALFIAGAHAVMHPNDCRPSSSNTRR